jgi:hypothetical protein
MGHSFTRKLRCIPWPICIHCGLIRLNNEATRKSKCERE